MRSIRLKIIAATLVVLVVPLYLLSAYFIQSFNRFTSKALEDELINYAYIVGEQFRQVNVADAHESRRFHAFLVATAAKVKARLMVLSPQGIVQFDSDAASQVGQDFSDRPEVAAARAGRYQARYQMTPDRAYVYYFIPLAVLEEGEVTGVVYVVRHTSPIIRAIGEMKQDQRLAMAASACVAVLLSAIVAQTITRRLRKLTRAARGLSQEGGRLEADVEGADEVAELGRAMVRMSDELEQRNRYNRDFVSTVMHELKMPLTAIKGATELLEQGAAERPEPRRKFLANIHYETDRLVRLVGELNELVRLDVEVLHGPRVRVDYGEFMRGVVDRLMPTFDEPHARFSVNIPEPPMPVLIAPGRMEQVISNLLDNAFRYTPAGGEVGIVVEVSDHRVITHVRDTGCGIAATNLGRVFDRFFTTEPKDKPKHYGSGLGLAIARRIVENHQGIIRVESEPGHGATFTIELPQAPGRPA